MASQVRVVEVKVVADSNFNSNLGSELTSEITALGGNFATGFRIVHIEVLPGGRGASVSAPAQEREIQPTTSAVRVRAIVEA